MTPKVLIVDDSATVRKACRLFLLEEDFEVIITSDAARVLDIIAEIKPDVVVTDIMMPEMDGYTFLRRLREEESLASLPVIIMSSKKRESMEGLFASCGISAYLEKPFGRKEFVKTIQGVLGR